MLNDKIGKFEQERELCFRTLLPKNKKAKKKFSREYRAVGFVLTAFSLD